jgi:RNA polymerase subunit RPABC4/transcription elongation factor Spt4
MKHLLEEDEMKNCKKCGGLSTDGTEQCPDCGKIFDAEEMKKWNDYLEKQDENKKNANPNQRLTR